MLLLEGASFRKSWTSERRRCPFPRDWSTFLRTPSFSPPVDTASYVEEDCIGICAFRYCMLAWIALLKLLLLLLRLMNLAPWFLINHYYASSSYQDSQGRVVCKLAASATRPWSGHHRQ